MWPHGDCIDCQKRVESVQRIHNDGQNIQATDTGKPSGQARADIRMQKQDFLYMIPTYRRNWIALTALLSALLMPLTVSAAEATVILAQDCQYVLLDSPQGQVLIKLIKGDPPKPGDTLSGEFHQRDFTELKVKRTGATVNAWIDMIDHSGSKALMRYSQYCQ